MQTTQTGWKLCQNHYALYHLTIWLFQVLTHSCGILYIYMCQSYQQNFRYLLLKNNHFKHFSLDGATFVKWDFFADWNYLQLRLNIIERHWIDACLFEHVSCVKGYGRKLHLQRVGNEQPLRLGFIEYVSARLFRHQNYYCKLKVTRGAFF